MLRLAIICTLSVEILCQKNDHNDPVVQLYPGISNIPDNSSEFTWPPIPPWSNIYKYLGIFSSVQKCSDACLAYRNIHVSPVSGWTRSLSFTFLPDLGNKCYAVVYDIWSPTERKSATTGRITWPPAYCSDDTDCSYNGKCQSDKLCSCYRGWRGDRCQTLDLLPAERNSGLQLVDDGHNTSTWGGDVVIGDDGKYHMFASEMERHCGINAWTTNSHVIRAVSDTPGGIYSRVEEVFGVFSHEPNIARSPTGEYVMHFTAKDPLHPIRPKCNCTDGSTDEKTCPSEPWGTSPTWMSYSKNPEGPWSTPVEIFKGAKKRNMDTNLAIVILKNGSVVGMARTSGEPESINMHLVTASYWKDASSYICRWDELLFPPDGPHAMTAAGVEDPFLYMDHNDNFHAVFHNQIEGDDMRLCGGHAWSGDGIQWTFGGTAWNNTVTFTDGTNFVFSRRERPHLIFGDPSNPYTITHLSTSVQTGDGKSKGDACYTLVQPVKH